MKHTYRKRGAPDREAAQYIRSWCCSKCGATKVRVTAGKKQASPRVTVERRVSSEGCAK